MGNQYKIIVSNNKIFKEVEIPAEANEFSIGTELGCDVRLRKDMFFNQFQITFIRNGDNWTVVCSDNIYFTDDGIRKLMTKSLVHGDILEVRYQLADNELLRLEFLIDFARGNITYNRAIDVSTANALRIGNEAGCDISISSNLVNGDIVELVRKGDDFAISKDQTVYGIYINDKKASVGAVIENGSFFSISDFFFYYKNGKLWTEKRTGLRTELPHVDSYMPDYYPAIRRSTRLKKAIDETPIQILDPPSKMEKPKNNLLMRLMPSLGMFAASAAMACIGGYMVICSAISGVMAVITAIMSVRETNKDYKKSIADRQEKYTNYIERKREEIKDLREEEKEILEGTYISSEKEESLFREFSPDLFDRTPADADFMCVRLGTGSRTAGKIINYKKQEVLEVEDELQGMPETLSKEFRDIENAPVTCDLKAINALGITGPEQARFDLLKNIVIDLAARHYQKDLKMVFIAAEEHRNRIRWLRTLPHVYNQSEGTRNIVCDEEGRTAIFEYLLKEMTERQEAEEKREHLVVFVYDEYGFNKHPVSRFVSCAAELGVTFLFFGQNRYSLSQGCNTIIEIGEENSAKLISMSDGQSSSEFTYRTVDDRTAKAIVDLLTPLYTEEVSLESSLTKNISLFELMNIIAVDDINLEERWNNSMVYKSMAAPIGVSTNRVVELDLHDKFHGPHGLVAGTTGSGKSEILQTYVLAMATLFHPYEVGFVIIDFKGGGMANQFDGLPHMMGTITNIDGREIERSLKSIKAELRKRQEYFSEAGVNHIDKYIKKYKEGEVRNPLPHLIIIVDEFAELKADQPEFMKELISAARIGRSLGVHLILATQKPAGQVDEQIWSNSRFKLCLKVQTTEDSKEVLKSPLAAEIKEPGRAYLQVGNNEIFELFQSAYSGAPEKEATMGLREFKIFSLSDSGKRTPVFAQKNQVADGDNTTQLTAIVDYVHDYFEGLNMPKLPDICLPSLEHVIDFPEGLAAHRSGSDIIADIGIFDDTDSQIQEQYSINLSKQNVLMIGS
ncbi:MAG: type VII secretion protein EssC, partial [Bacillota bacterium]|nr:type VII secretion protein EssC [Bacillota bacterium]